MELIISGKHITKYNTVDIVTKFDSVAGTFAFKLYFDPAINTYKEFYKPLTYRTVVIKHGGVTVMTGTILSHRFGSAGDPPRRYVDISGYSITGILEDCTILNTDILNSLNNTQVYTVPSQFNGLNLTEITNQICAMFPLKVIVDPEVADACAATYPKTEMKIDQSIKQYLDTLCKQKNIVLSHDALGNVFLTRAKTDSLLTTSTTRVFSQLTDHVIGHVTKTTSVDRAVLYDFAFAQDGNPAWIDMSLSVNGQVLHSVTQVIGQTGIIINPDGSTKIQNASDVIQFNPFVTSEATPPFRVIRYNRVVQTSGDDNATLDTARSIAGDELKKAIVLTIKVNGWVLNGHLITPNQMVTVTNPDLYLYQKTKFFIQEVRLYGDEKEEYAVLTCVLPTSFNADEIVNIFK